MKKQIAIIVSTSHKSVYFGLVDEGTDLTQRTLKLDGARMAIYWGTTKGVGQLAKTGPTSTSRIGDRADLHAIHNIDAVYAVTDAARAAWEAA